MQPAMGAGIAASRMPNPRAARLRNIATHTVYGFGLYCAAVALVIRMNPTLAALVGTVLFLATAGFQATLAFGAPKGSEA